MAKAKPTVRDIVAPVLPMDEIKKLSQKDACARFAERATVSQRAFAEMGKLHFAISASLRKGQTLYGELRKFGVKDSTISNASYASKVFDLVVKEHLTEADYDSFTFADCLATVRAMSERSKRRLTGEEVAALVKAQPGSFDTELQSIYETGLTVEEAEAQAKAEAERRAREEAAAKAEAAAKTEQAKQAAIAAALQREREQQEAAAAAAATATVPSAGAKPQAPPSELPQSAKAAPVAGAAAPNPPPPAAPAKPPVIAAVPPMIVETPPAAPEPDKEEPSPAPANVTAMPANPDAALVDVLNALDEILVAASDFSPDARKSVLAKLNECTAFLAEQLEVTSAA